jgi:hypothetical protein
VTVVPVLIVRIVGLKAKFLIAIEFDWRDGSGVVVIGEEVQPENEQVKISKIAQTEQKIVRKYTAIVSLKAGRNKKMFLPDSIKRSYSREVSLEVQQHHYSTKWWVRFITSR